MKNKISNKLFKVLSWTLIITASIAITGLICIKILKNTAHNLVVEYIELNAIQELRISVNQIMPLSFDYLYYRDVADLNRFEYFINKSLADTETCHTSLTHRHNKEVLHTIKEQLELYYSTTKQFSSDYLKTEITHQHIKELENIVTQINNNILSILNETNKEINEFIVIYETASKHSTLVIITFSFLIIIIGLWFGYKFVLNITNPISDLAKSIQFISTGNFSTRSKIKTDDELEDLSNSFNIMAEKLEQTTVSRNYFDNILSNMMESLLVTDLEGNILLCNSASEQILGYNKAELTTSNISILMPNDFNFKKLIISKTGQNIETTYINKDKTETPILLSYSTLENENPGINKIIIVAHNLKERKIIEEKLKLERRKHRIAINDAEEKERLKIATEIHDGIGQMLTGVSYSIDSYFMEKNPNDEDYILKTKQLQNQIDNIIKESKQIAYDLMPFLLKDFGLITAIKNLLSETEQKTDINFYFEHFNCDHRFDDKLEKAIYRILQEAINNIIKHSKATESRIQIIKHSASLSIVIEDNGIGFDINDKTNPSGIGLISMTERVSTFSGFLNINSSINNGTEIVIEIPCLKN